MQLFAVVATLCLTSMATAFNATEHHWSNFQKFITRFDKSYSNLIEFEKKFEVFKSNME